MIIMAKLQKDNLTLGINFTRLEDEWIAYEISFLWKNKPIINEDILKKDRWWNKRKYGTFLANDYGKDSLIETIKKSIETSKNEYWEPIEPDAKISIYPEDDLFTIIVLINTYNFEDCSIYSSDGISLHLSVEKTDLEKFVTELEEEYNIILTEV